jgi:hypothetical protein
MALTNIIKTIITQIGSIVKIDYIDVRDISAIGKPSPLNQLPSSGVVLVGGKTWKNLDILNNCQLTEDEENNNQGDLYTIAIEGATMLAPTEAAKLSRLLKARVALKITDGNGFVYLVGNKTEFFKFSFKTDTGQSRSVAKLIEFKCTGALTSGLIQLI